jgi:ribosome maturation factor RimP
MNEAAVEAAIRTLGREVTDIKNVMKEQNRILERMVNHQGRLIDTLEKITKGENAK